MPIKKNSRPAELSRLGKVILVVVGLLLLGGPVVAVLIYLQVTQKVVVQEFDLTLPELEMEEAPGPFEMVSIDLLDGSEMEVNGKAFPVPAGSRELPELVAFLVDFEKQANSRDASAQIVLSAEESARGQRFVDVLNAIDEAGISNVTLSGFTE